MPPTATPCRLAQLAIAFDGGGEGAGNQLGELTLWNVGSTACRLDQPVLVAAMDTTDHRLEQVTPMVSVAASPPLVLPASTPTPGQGARPENSPTVAAIPIYGKYRDDPHAANGMCTPAHEVRPARWRITIGGQSTTVVNTTTNPHNANLGVEGCRGAIATGPQSRL